MKHTHELEGIGCAIQDLNENHLDLGKPVQITDLFELAGAEVLSVDQVDSFEYAREWEPCAAIVREYQARSGRDYPRLYRVKIQIELEEMPEDETHEYWIKRQR